MDPLLFPLHDASENAARARLIEELVWQQAAPLARQMMWKWLHFNVDAHGYDPYHQDAADLYQEILAKILQALQRLLKSNELSKIENFRQYTLRLATNACHDYRREQSPIRSRCKMFLRDLLQRHDSFATWRSEGATLCGFAVWQGREKSTLAQRRLLEAIDQPEPLQTVISPLAHLSQENLSQVVASMLDWAGGPVRSDLLLSALVSVLNLQDYIPSSLDEENELGQEHLSVAVSPGTSSLEERDTLRHLWREICQLSPAQRDTFCFSFADVGGEDLFTLLLYTDAVTFPDIAQALGYSEPDLRVLWERMPLNSTEIAEILIATRPQVNKWRFRATEKLRKVLLPKPVLK